MSFILICAMLYGIFGCALSCLNTSNTPTLKRPSYWVALGCLMLTEIVTAWYFN